MATSISVELSKLLKEMNRYTIDENFGFRELSTDKYVYMSPHNMPLFLMYVIRVCFGVFDCVCVIDDIKAQESEDTDSPDTYSLCGYQDLVSIIQLSSPYGVYMNVEDSFIPDRHVLMVSEELGGALGDIGDIDVLLQRIEESVLLYCKEHIDRDMEVDLLNTYGPKYLYAGKLLDYKTFRDLSVVVAEKLGTTLLYYNTEEYEKVRESIETEEKHKRFIHVLRNFSEEEVYQFSSEDRFVKIFSHRPLGSNGEYESSDFPRRSIKDKYFQTLEFYKWIKDQRYKVYVFGNNISMCLLDASFYAALALAEINLGITVLLFNTEVYNRMLADLNNLEFADFTTRFKRVLELYKPGSIRILLDNYGHSNIGVINSFNLGLQFSGVELNSLKRYITETGEGKFVIAMDLFNRHDNSLDILTQDKFNEYNQSKFKIKILNVYEALASAYYGDNLSNLSFVDKSFEEYLYCTCRFLDQILNDYSKTTMVTELACIKVVDTTGELPPKIYVGTGELHPVAMCDVLVLSDEGLYMPNVKYSGRVMDALWIDDLDETTFHREVDGEEKITFIEKIKCIYNSVGKECPESILNLESSRIPPLKDVGLFMAMVYGSGCTTSVSLIQNIYDMQKSNYLNEECEMPMMFPSKLTPIYFGIALNNNVKSRQYLLPYILEYTTSYGYRQLEYRYSPINIFGGIVLDYGNAETMWLYPQLFQHHKKMDTLIKGGYK